MPFLIRLLLVLVATIASLARAEPVPTAAQLAEMERIAFDQTRTIEDRIAGIRRVMGMKEGEYIERRICIWDIAGRTGPVFTLAQDQVPYLLAHGVKAEMIPYTSETVVVEDLKAGLCDAALISGLRARLFNRFTGTIDSIGGVPSEEHMHVLLEVLADSRVADQMVSGQYVVLGIAPAGGAYIFVNDRAINTLAKAAGKRVAVLDYDPVQAEMVAQVGASPVPSDIISAPGKFNNGVVDVLAAPLIAYELLELYKGMGEQGGIVNYPLAFISMQLIGRVDRFPNSIAQISREIFYDYYDTIIARLEMEAAKVPDHWWVELPDRDKEEYEVMMQEARLELRKRGYYDPAMLTLQRKIRCKLDGTRPECADPVE